MEQLDIAISILHIVLQGIAALLAWRLTKFTGYIRAWGLVAGAIALIVLRRAITLAISAGWLAQAQWPSYAETVLLFAISIMLVWGMWDLNKLFEKKYGSGK
jgi:hypothetical protein